MSSLLQNADATSTCCEREYVWGERNPPTRIHKGVALQAQSTAKDARFHTARGALDIEVGVERLKNRTCGFERHSSTWGHLRLHGPTGGQPEPRTAD